jgi:hypothetical protein
VGTATTNQASGTLNVGTVTATGKDANAAAQTGNPISIGGTDSGGTVRTISVDSTGAIKTSASAGGTNVNVVTGTINVGTFVMPSGTLTTGSLSNVAMVNAGTIVIPSGTITTGSLSNVAMFNAGTISTLPNLPGGSIVITAGTIASDTVVGGTLQMLNAGTISMLNAGTLNIGTIIKSTPASVAGSFTATGTANFVGSQYDTVGIDVNGTWVGTAFFEGQIGTSAFFGIPAISNAGVVGTQIVGNGDYFLDTTGLSNARLRLTYSSGTMTYNAQQTEFESASQYLTGGTLGNVGSITNVGMLNAGTLTTGSLSNLALINAGTLTTITGNVGGLSTGTITTGSLSNVAMLNAGTISTLPNIPGGTINILAGGTLGILTNGTLSSSGTTTGVGSVSNLGSMAMLTAGTISMINAGTLTSIGTTTGVGVLTTLTAMSLGTVTGKDANAAAQTSNPVAVGGTDSGGTVRTVVVDSTGAMKVSNVAAGTTIGTINTGTLSPIPTIANVTYGTHGTTGVSIFGTLAGGTGSGAGTEIFCTSVSLSIPSTGGSQDVSIGWGTNGGTFHAGTGLLVRGNFPAGGGIQKTFWPPVNSGTQAQLCLFQAGAGTVDVSVTYFITASTL